MACFNTVSVKISTHKSIDLLKFLAQNNFSTFYVDNCSGTMTIIDPFTITDQKLDELDKSDPKWFSFQSIYGGTALPPQKVFTEIYSNKKVLSFQLRYNRIP